MIEWIQDNGAELLVAVYAAHTVALFIVNATPTPKDNAALAKVYKVVELVAGLLTKRVKK